MYIYRLQNLLNALMLFTIRPSKHFLQSESISGNADAIKIINAIFLERFPFKSRVFILFYENHFPTCGV